MNTTTSSLSGNSQSFPALGSPIINIDFMPTKDSLPSDLLRMKDFIYQSKHCKNSDIRLITNCGLILLIIPLLIPIRERLKIEFRFEESSSQSLFTSNYENCRNFKDILESSRLLQQLNFQVSFAKSVQKL